MRVGSSPLPGLPIGAIFLLPPLCRPGPREQIRCGRDGRSSPGQAPGCPRDPQGQCLARAQRERDTCEWTEDVAAVSLGVPRASSSDWEGVGIAQKEAEPGTRCPTCQVPRGASGPVSPHLFLGQREAARTPAAAPAGPTQS